MTETNIKIESEALILYLMKRFNKTEAEARQEVESRTTTETNCVIGYKDQNGSIVNSHFFKDIPDKPETVNWQCENSDGETVRCKHVREFKNKLDDPTFNNQDKPKSKLMRENKPSSEAIDFLLGGKNVK